MHTPRRSRRIRAAALLALAVLAVAPLAQSKLPGAAAARSSARAPKGPSALTSNLIRRLQSSDAAQVRSALDGVRTGGKAAAGAVPFVAERLRKGLCLELTRAAIEMLADIGAETASVALSLYTVHRDLTIRRGAVKALAKIGGPAAAPALERALSDSDATVRGLAAAGLGDLGVHGAMEPLFAALDRRVNEAAASVGALCTAAECRRLLGKLTTIPFAVVTEGLARAMARPDTEVDDEVKIEIVDRVRELGTAEAHEFLRQLQERAQDEQSPLVQQSIDEAVVGTAAAGRSP